MASPPVRRRPAENNATDGGWACDVCGLVFATGQALGGHKGSHKAGDHYSVSGFGSGNFTVGFNSKSGSGSG